MPNRLGGAIVRLHAEIVGRGPARARGDMVRDPLFVVPEDTLTRWSARS